MKLIQKMGGGSYSDPIFDTANIKFYNYPEFTQYITLNFR